MGPVLQVGDRGFESCSLQRRVIQNPVPELPKGLRPDAGGVGPLRAGRITLEEALQRYELTEEEYRSWERAFEQHGLAGLRSTRLQQYRGPRPPRGPRLRR